MRLVSPFFVKWCSDILLKRILFYVLLCREQSSFSSQILLLILSTLTCKIIIRSKRNSVAFNLIIYFCNSFRYT